MEKKIVELQLTCPPAWLYQSSILKNTLLCFHFVYIVGLYYWFSKWSFFMTQITDLKVNVEMARKSWFMVSIWYATVLIWNVHAFILEKLVCFEKVMHFFLKHKANALSFKECQRALTHWIFSLSYSFLALILEFFKHKATS